MVATAFALLFAGLMLAMALHGSHAAQTHSLVPAQTQTAP
jgi:hypothetical protein